MYLFFIFLVMNKIILLIIMLIYIIFQFNLEHILKIISIHYFLLQLVVINIIICMIILHSNKI